MQALLIFAAAWVLHSAWEHVRADYRRSRDARIADVAAASPEGEMPPRRRAAVARHHWTGYWSREILSGFPVTRTGIHTGWLAHRTALAQAEARRTETRLTLRQRLAEHHRRLTQATAEAESVSDGPRECAASVADITERRRGKAVAAGSAGGGASAPGPYAPDGDAVPDGDRDTAPAPGAPRVTADPRGPMVAASTDLDEMHRVAREGSLDGRARTVYENDGHGGNGGSRVAATYANGEIVSPGSQNGVPVSADTTYDSIMARSAEVADQADGMGAAAKDRLTEVTQIADDMQGSRVGTRTVAAATDAIDAWKAVEQALGSAAEAEAHFASEIEANHQQLNEAHQDATDGAAEPEFYAG